MTERYVYREGLGVVPAHLAPPRHVAGDAPFVIHDTIDHVQNPADGQRYTSKRAYERAVRDAGCEIVGNQSLAELKLERNRPRLDSPEHRAARRVAIRRAITQQEPNGR